MNVHEVSMSLVARDLKLPLGGARSLDRRSISLTSCRYRSSRDEGKQCGRTATACRRRRGCLRPHSTTPTPDPRRLARDAYVGIGVGVVECGLYAAARTEPPMISRRPVDYTATTTYIRYDNCRWHAGTTRRDQYNTINIRPSSYVAAASAAHTSGVVSVSHIFRVVASV